MALPADFIVIGHRGAAGLVAENTLPSFKKALTLGCRWLELDVHRLAASDTLVVIHDEQLERTTSASGQVERLKPEDLKLIDAGNGARIPLLHEVIDLLQEHCSETGISLSSLTLNIELKGAGTADPVARFIDQQQGSGPTYFVSAFQHAQLAAFRLLDSTTAVAPLYDRWRNDCLNTAGAVGARAVNLSQRICNARRVQSIRNAGFEVYAYTVNRLADAQRLSDWGVNGVFTDRPDRLLPAIGIQDIEGG